MSGHVSNFNSTFKIYELHINRANIDALTASDLYIEVTPCNGRVTFFVSNDYTNLFDKDKEIKAGNFLDIRTQQQFGKLTTRVANLQKFP